MLRNRRGRAESRNRPAARNGNIDFVHVRHEEYGVFAAVADAYFTGRPSVVCGTAGPGVTYLINGLIDATREGAPVIAIAGDVERSLIDTCALEELNPYKFFATACLYVGRIVDPQQARASLGRPHFRFEMVQSEQELSQIQRAFFPDQARKFPC